MESTKFRLVSAGLREDLIGNLGPVHVPSEEFVNAALFLRLGLPNTREKCIAHACLPCFRRIFAIEIIRDNKTN